MEHYVKSNEQSKTLREIGNQFYENRSFFDAILKYNEALCYAENDSENAGLAYANRSAVYFEMKIYDKSLKNIVLARANNYPKKNFEILKKREVKCYEMMKNNQPTANDLNFFKLSYESYKNLPSIANCLELKSDDKYGRHIITNRNLSVGDIVAIEDPFCKILKQDFIYKKCSNCFQSNLLDLQPCLKCNRAMFCSVNCEKTAQINFHHYECPIMQLTASSFLNSNMRTALRTFFISLSIFDDSIEYLIKFFDENSSHCVTLFDFETKLNMKQKLLVMNSLVHNKNFHVDDTLFEQIFQLNEKFINMWDHHKEFIKKFLRKQTQIAEMNYHEIYGWPLKKVGLNDDELETCKESFAYRRQIVPFGNASYPFCSMLNHSCAPNVYRTFIDDQIVLVVQRKIEAGCQIFDNYGYSFTHYDRDFRQTTLLKQYKFICECEMCVNNIGLLPTLKICDKINLKQAKKISKELSNLNQNKAKNCFKEIAKIIQNSKNFPSLEICSLMESFAACLEIILKPRILLP